MRTAILRTHTKTPHNRFFFSHTDRTIPLHKHNQPTTQTPPTNPISRQTRQVTSLYALRACGATRPARVSWAPPLSIRRPAFGHGALPLGARGQHLVLGVGLLLHLLKKRAAAAADGAAAAAELLL